MYSERGNIQLLIWECRSLSPELRGLPFDGFLCGCGTYLYYHNQILLEHPISYERGLAIIEKMEECRMEGVLEGAEALYYKEEAYRCRVLEQERERMKNLSAGKAAVMEKKDFQYDKFMVYVDEQSDAETFFVFLEDDMEILDYKNGFFECVQKDYSKATGIDFFRNYLQIPLEQVYVFGDSCNDESMFAYAKHTIAMGKHDKKLDLMTEYVTDTVENDGIYKALVHYGLI